MDRCSGYSRPLGPRYQVQRTSIGVLYTVIFLALTSSPFQSNYKAHEFGKNESVNFGGNSKRALHVSIRDSLKKLQTDYIDILCEYAYLTKT